MSLLRTAINRKFLFNRMPDKSRLAFSVIAKQDILPRDPSNPNREITMTTEAEKTQRKASCPRTMVYRNVPPRGRLSGKGLLFNRVPNKSRLAFSVIAKQDILTTRLIEPQSRNQCRRPKRKKTQRKRIEMPPANQRTKHAPPVSLDTLRGEQLYYTDRSVIPVLPGILCAPRQRHALPKGHCQHNPWDPAKHSAKDEQQRGAVSNIINASAMQS